MESECNLSDMNFINFWFISKIWNFSESLFKFTLDIHFELCHLANWAIQHVVFVLPIVILNMGNIEFNSVITGSVRLNIII